MDSFFKSIFDNTPKDFAVEAGAPPKDIVDAAVGGATNGPEDPGKQSEQTDQNPNLKDIVHDAKEAGAQNREKHAFRNKAKETYQKTREVAKTTSDVVRGLASKDVRGELGKFVVDKLDNAGDKLEDKYDNILNKADQKRDAAVAKTKDTVTNLADKTKDKLVTQPAEKVKGWGRGVKEYFANKGHNIADGIRARKADADAKYYQKKADKYDNKYEKFLQKQERTETKIEDARDGKVPRLERKRDRMAAKGERFSIKVQAHKELAQEARGNANRFRANIASRKNK
jgi:hypothetical protein